MPQARDIIPDLHADPARLDRTLRALGQRAPLAFLGDFIDMGGGRRGDDPAVLTRIRDLIESGRAVAVMGNHELNAILFHRKGTGGRPHLKKNLRQHQSFIAHFGIATSQALDWTRWFLQALPLWRDLGGLRLVHACWDQTAIATIARRRPDGHLREEDLAEAADPATDFGRAVKLLTSGPETALPDGYRFHDNGGHPRQELRLAWWRGSARTWREAALSVPDPNELPDAPLPDGLLAGLYPQDAAPVLVGHYKMTGPPRIEAPNALCLDYPAQPCAYCWRGEARLDTGNLLAV